MSEHLEVVERTPRHSNPFVMGAGVSRTLRKSEVDHPMHQRSLRRLEGTVDEFTNEVRSQASLSLLAVCTNPGPLFEGYPQTARGKNPQCLRVSIPAARFFSGPRHCQHLPLVHPMLWSFPPHSSQLLDKLPHTVRGMGVALLGGHQPIDFGEGLQQGKRHRLGNLAGFIVVVSGGHGCELLIHDNVIQTNFFRNIVRRDKNEPVLTFSRAFSYPHQQVPTAYSRQQFHALTIAPKT